MCVCFWWLLLAFPLTVIYYLFLVSMRCFVPTKICIFIIILVFSGSFTMPASMPLLCIVIYIMKNTTACILLFYIHVFAENNIKWGIFILLTHNDLLKCTICGILNPIFSH